MLLILRALSIGSGAYFTMMFEVSLAVWIWTSPYQKSVCIIPAVCAFTSCTLSSENSVTVRESTDICSIHITRVSVIIKRSSSSFIHNMRINVRNMIQYIEIPPQ